MTEQVSACLQSPRNPEELMEKLRSTEVSVRLSALAGFFNSQIDVESYVEAIAILLGDENLAVRFLVVVLLGRARAKATGPLIGALDISQPVSIRIASATAIAGMGQEGFPAVNALCRCLNSTDVNERKYAGLALSKIGQPAVPPLLALLDDPQKLTVELLQALGWMSAPASAAIDKLRSIARDLTGESQAVCYSALINITNESQKELPALLECYTTGDAAIRKVVIEQIGYLRKLGTNFIPLLLQAVSDFAAPVRAKAALALARVETNTMQAVAPLIDLLQDTDEEVQINAAIALGSRGPSACLALPELRRLSQNGNKQLENLTTAAINAITNG